MAKIVKTTMPEWLMNWIVSVSKSDETTVSEFMRRSATDRCERRDQEGSSRVPRALIGAARAARRGMARGKLRRISEALGRATDTVDAICIAEPIRSQLNSALQDLQIATDLIFDQDAAIHCHSVNDNED